ncbi:hypothetical protein CNMCM7691_002005 [Aspergillus felis]|uniref:tRNA-splicing endonuclease subunit Sen2 n=1 Tax=Aspergillus felis TaxID=1287682 RepID=A0A8H6VD13_9EURO|nr:hypothetical protein CNMCM7691_002005 [Aspergillus felis]
MASSSTSIPSSHAELPGSLAKSMPHNNSRPPHRSRPPKPNYKHIHRFPLPLDVHALPPLIPHNPLSLISVVLSYLTYFISPPHKETYAAYFDSATSSVHVTDERAIQALWEMGFFGKGALSRSQPSWLEREKKRRGLLGGQTNEELTRQRRTERRELKLERARMEKVAIEQRLKAEAAARENGAATVDQATTTTLLTDGAPGDTGVTLEKFSLRKAREARMLESQRSKKQENHGPASPSPGQESPSKAVRFSPVVQEKEFVSGSAILHGPAPEAHETSQEERALNNEEHLQLSNEEAFFLAYGLGVLHVYDHQQKNIIPPTSLLSLFCHNSYYPPRDPSAVLNPDDPFLISYIVYHHFRSLGWVVRSGVKFGVDYLLYNRGPVFSHAEFAVVVIPAYEHSYWSETSDRRSYCATKQTRSWWWLHCVNRVQAQVKKSLVVCYVEVPPPRSHDSKNHSEDIGALLSRYRVREMLIRRWVPNRTRD